MKISSIRSLSWFFRVVRAELQVHSNKTWLNSRCLIWSCMFVVCFPVALLVLSFVRVWRRRSRLVRELRNRLAWPTAPNGARSHSDARAGIEGPSDLSVATRTYPPSPSSALDQRLACECAPNEERRDPAEQTSERSDSGRISGASARDPAAVAQKSDPDCAQKCSRRAATPRRFALRSSRDALLTDCAGADPMRASFSNRFPIRISPKRSL